VAYLTLAETLVAFPSLKEQYDKERVSGERIAGWIKEATDLINGYVGSRYQLPFAVTPPLIETLALELFEYYWQKSTYTPTSTGEEVPWLYARYDRIIKLLQQISDGKLMLFDSNGLEIETASRKLGILDSNHIDNDPIFTMKDAEEQEIPDPYGEPFDED
jgi:phage gp36-like protein